MTIIVGSATIHPELRTEALALAIEHSVRSRAEPGCIAHNCHNDAEDSTRIVFVEEWTDMAAVKVHFAVPALGEFVRRIGVMAVGAPVMRVYSSRDVTATARE